MASIRKLLRRARENPAGLRFEEAEALAAALGFEYVRTAGSHKIYRHAESAKLKDRFPQPLNLQDKGKAKAYQVKQMLAMAEAAGTLPAETDEDEQDESGTEE